MTGEPPEVVVYLVLRLSSVEVYLKPLVWLHFYYFYYTSLGTFIRFNFIIDTLYNYLLSSWMRGTVCAGQLLRRVWVHSRTQCLLIGLLLGGGSGLPELGCECCHMLVADHDRHVN